jgi:hypothetical protein
VTPPTVQFIPASGPTLLIHDSFQSAGSSGAAWDGRTPDVQTVGSNTWFIPKSSTSLAFAYDSPSTCGIRTAYSSSSGNSQYKDTIAIDSGENYFRIVSKINAPAQSLNAHGVGICFWDGSGTTAGSETFGSVLIGFTNSFIIREVNGGTVTNLVTSTSTTFSAGSDYIIDLSVGPATVSASLYDSTGSSLLDSISCSTSSFSISPSSNVGSLFMGNGVGLNYGRALDFKVYA